MRLLILAIAVVAEPSQQELDIPFYLDVPFYFSAGIHRLAVDTTPPQEEFICDGDGEVQPALDVTSAGADRLATETIERYRDMFAFADSSYQSEVLAEIHDDLANTIESHKYSYRPNDRCSWPSASGVFDNLPVECLNVHTAMVYAGFVDGKKRKGTRRGDSMKMLRTNVLSRKEFPALLGDCGLNREDALWVEVGVLRGDFGRRLLEEGGG